MSTPTAQSLHGTERQVITPSERTMGCPSLVIITCSIDFVPTGVIDIKHLSLFASRQCITRLTCQQICIRQSSSVAVEQKRRPIAIITGRRRDIRNCRRARYETGRVISGPHHHIKRTEWGGRHFRQGTTTTASSPSSCSSLSFTPPPLASTTQVMMSRPDNDFRMLSARTALLMTKQRE